MLIGEYYFFFCYAIWLCLCFLLFIDWGFGSQNYLVSFNRYYFRSNKCFLIFDFSCYLWLKKRHLWMTLNSGCTFRRCEVIIQKCLAFLNCWRKYSRTWTGLNLKLVLQTTFIRINPYSSPLGTSSCSDCSLLICCVNSLHLHLF